MSSVSYKDGITALPTSLKDRVPEEYLQESAVVAVGRLTAPVTAPSVTREQKDKDRSRIEGQFHPGRNPNAIKIQPRDYRGRFREVLARLKINLGESDLNEEVAKVQEAEDAEYRGNYTKAAEAATDVVQMVDRLDSGSLNPDQINNIKATTRDLGKAIAFLPLPQGDANAKLRYSDLPPATQQLIVNMKKRVLAKLTPEKAALLLEVLNAFTSGQIQLSSDDLQAELSKMLTYLID